jgi:hypothetical protein
MLFASNLNCAWVTPEEPSILWIPIEKPSTKAGFFKIQTRVYRNAMDIATLHQPL